MRGRFVAWDSTYLPPASEILGCWKFGILWRVKFANSWEQTCSRSATRRSGLRDQVWSGLIVIFEGSAHGYRYSSPRSDHRLVRPQYVGERAGGAGDGR